MRIKIDLFDHLKIRYERLCHCTEVLVVSEGELFGCFEEVSVLRRPVTERDERRLSGLVDVEEEQVLIGSDDTKALFACKRSEQVVVRDHENGSMTSILIRAKK